MRAAGGVLLTIACLSLAIYSVPFVTYVALSAFLLGIAGFVMGLRILVRGSTRPTKLRHRPRRRIRASRGRLVTRPTRPAVWHASRHHPPHGRWRGAIDIPRCSCAEAGAAVGELLSGAPRSLMPPPSEGRLPDRGRD